MRKPRKIKLKHQIIETPEGKFKICSECGDKKLVEDNFAVKSKNITGGGYSNSCKQCEFELYHRPRYLDIREKQIKYAKQWQKDNPDKVREYERKKIKSKKKI